MPRDMTGTGRYPPQPRFQPFNFYSCVRVGDPEQLKLIMDTDPYFWSQDNGAGAPIHFAATYKQLDMLHHIVRNCPETVNQRDTRGLTALHRAAFLAHHDGYLEIYEYLLSEGADPSILSDDYDPYLFPGRHAPVELAVEMDEVRKRIRALEDKYKDMPKVPEPHEDFGDWWTLYDYGPETVKTWKKGYKHPYPETLWRQREAETARQEKEARRARRAAKASGTLPITVPKAVSNTPVAFLFPGQGSQAVGMLASVKDLPAVRTMLSTAHRVLGFDLLEMCTNGPKASLDDTVNSQPALFVAGLAAVEKLRADNPSVVESASACAGLSLGEYCALVFAGVLSFEDGLKVVKVRAQSMAAAAKQGQHGMLSVVGMADPELENICNNVVKNSPPGTVCRVANYLFPQGRVVSGDKTALEEVQKAAAAAGALKAQMVAVSGAFHTSRMDPAAEALKQVLAEVTFNEPRMPVYSNVTGAPFEDAASIPGLLARQLVEPVKWEGSVQAMIGAGKTSLYELGPGAQIKAMIKRIDGNVWKTVVNVQP